MKFSCTKTALQEAISAAGRAVASKSTIPALEGLLITADETLRITGFNLDLGITCTVEAADAVRCTLGAEGFALSSTAISAWGNDVTES